MRGVDHMIVQPLDASSVAFSGGFDGSQHLTTLQIAD